MVRVNVLLCVMLGVLVASASAVSRPAGIPLLVGLKQQNLDKLREFVDAVSDPNSPTYGRYLAPEELRSMIGAETHDVRQVSDWLLRHGATAPFEVLATGDYLLCYAPASKVLGIIRDAPSMLPGLVDVVVRADPDAVSLASDLEALHTAESAGRATSHPKSAGRKLRGPAPATLGGPNTQRSAYGIPSGERGSAPSNSQMVWGPGTYGFLDSDLESFYNTFSVNESTSLLHHLGFKGVPGGDNFGEATLDVSYISGIGQGIKTYVYNSNSSMSTEEGDGFGAAILHFVASLATASAPAIPRTLSISLGSLTYRSCQLLCDYVAGAGQGVDFDQCWAYMQQQRQVCMFKAQVQITRTSTEFQKLAARGITVLAAAGDGGSHYSFQPFPSGKIGDLLNSASCAKNFPTYPASDPYVTGVGGTIWNGAPTSPTPWGGSGGGFSWTFPMPSYQKATVSAYLASASVPPASAFNSTNRAYPDVAALGMGVPMYVDGQLVVAGGTSAAAPEFSGLVSLINDRRLLANKPPLGFINPRLYQIAAEHPGEAFYTMSTGTSACTSAGTCCPKSTSFPAAKDWDPITGLGSPLWPGLFKYLADDV